VLGDEEREAVVAAALARNYGATQRIDADG
jgi:hypothetical protein